MDDLTRINRQLVRISIITFVEQEYLGTKAVLSANPKLNTFVKYTQEQDKASTKKFWKEQLTSGPAPVFPPSKLHTEGVEVQPHSPSP